MRKQLLQLSFIALALIFISGCGKDDDPVPAKTKTELITTGSWKFQSASSSLLGDIPSNNSLIACYTDNVMTFATNLSGTIVEGTNVCSSPAPSSFTWAFQTNETVLHLSFTLFAGGSPDFTIVSLNETNLVLSQQVTIAPYPTQTITVTFKH